MNEKQLGEALLKLNGTATPPNAGAPPGGSDMRGGRRVRPLVAAVFVLALLAAGGLAFALYAAAWHWYPKQKTLLRDAGQGRLSDEQIAAIQAVNYQALVMCTMIAAAALAALMLAAVVAVLLKRDDAAGALPADVASGDADEAHRMCRRILTKDRRRVHLLAALASGLWSASAAGAAWLIGFYFLFIAPRLQAYAEGRAQSGLDWNEWILTGDYAARILLTSIVSLLLAAVCTVQLVLASRRATLRQINAHLAEISQELRLLRGAAPESSGAAADA